MSATPLAGLRVLEFSHTVMGPTAGLIFAELGADVIKVEPAPQGDHTRGLGGFAAGFFAAFSRNKRSLAVDLKQAEGRAVVHRLIPTIDLVLENYGPGTVERLGCGYDQLAALNPRLIYLALKGYLAGPYEHRPALDEVVQFQTGLAFMTGPVGRPLRAGASVIDILGAIFGVVAAQAALRERENTGKGQRIGSALFESAAFLMSTHMAGMAATGLEARPMPARRGAWAIYEVFQTAGDGQLFIGVTSDQQWERFVEEFSLRELAADSRLATNVMRLGERVWLIPALQNVLATIRKRKSRPVAKEPTSPGPGSVGPAIFSQIRICWQPAACWMSSSRELEEPRAKKSDYRPYQSSSARAVIGQQSGDRHHGSVSTPGKFSPRRRFPLLRSQRFSKAARSSVPMAKLNKLGRNRTGRSGIEQKGL
jgi:crotonobetainyl-CoA:carnitine CoA-transferase CaiB-like acyl-CoA transferase